MSGETITLTVHGKEGRPRTVRGKAGQTLLEVFRENGIRVPTLCHHPKMPPYGGCRLCIVEIERVRGFPSSCATRAEDGMVVHTHSERVLTIRKTVLELLLAFGEHNCLLCERSGTCELQDLVYEHHIDTVRFRTSRPPAPVDDANPMIVRDPAKCVLCGRCVRGCLEVQVNGVIDFAGRGANSTVSTFGSLPLGESNCRFCGECVALCPTGALTYKKARFRGRPWELRTIATTCTHCGVGCQLELSVKDNKVVKVATNPVIQGPNRGSLCVHGRFEVDFIDHPDRLKTALVRERDGFRQACWDETLDHLAGMFRRIRDANGPESLAFVASPRCTNEENYLLNKFARAVIGTNNIDQCPDREFDTSPVEGLADAFGIGAMTNSIDDLDKADVILVTGADASVTHPVLSSAFKRAAQNGKTRLLVVESNPTELADFAHLRLRPKPGTEVMWLNGLAHVILAEGLHDACFVEERTEGFDAFRRTVAAYTPERVELFAGIPAKELISAARLYAGAPAASIAYGPVTAGKVSASDAVRCMANLSMLCGNIGIEGGGVNLLRMQSNEQGASDMGGHPRFLPGYQPVASAEARARFAEGWGVSSIPARPGLGMREIFEAAARKEIRGLYILGANPVKNAPDTNLVKKALNNLAFLVVHDLFMTETAQLADVVLPAACFAEKNGTFTNTERRVQRVRKALEPPDQAKSEWRILAALARQMGYPMDYKTPSDIFDEIARLTPLYGGMNYWRIEQNGLQWPCPSLDHPGTRVLHREEFQRGKGVFHAVDWMIRKGL